MDVLHQLDNMELKLEFSLVSFLLLIWCYFPPSHILILVFFSIIEDCTLWSVYICVCCFDVRKGSCRYCYSILRRSTRWEHEQAPSKTWSCCSGSFFVWKVFCLSSSKHPKQVCFWNCLKSNRKVFHLAKLGGELCLSTFRYFVFTII